MTDLEKEVEVLTMRVVELERENFNLRVFTRGLWEAQKRTLALTRELALLQKEHVIESRAGRR